MRSGNGVQGGGQGPSQHTRHGFERLKTDRKSDSMNGHADGFSKVWGWMFVSKTGQVYGAVMLLLILALINFLAFFAALRVGISSFNITNVDERLYTKDRIAGSTHHEVEYPLCLLLAVGDDSDRPNDVALPYSELHRLFDAVKAEIQSMKGLGISPMKILMGVDYASLPCTMMRDSLADSGLDAAVKFVCESPGVVWNGLVKARKDKVNCGTTFVGESSRYVTQLTLEWAQLMRWHALRVVRLDEEDPSHEPPAIPREQWRPTVVTAFSSNHFAVGALLLRSVAKSGKEAADLGLLNISAVVFTLEDFNSTLQSILECLVQEIRQEYNIDLEVRRFDFSAHPQWMRINQTLGYLGGTGEYAWKAVMVHEVLVERGAILWADAGCRFPLDGFIRSWNYTLEHGFANRHTAGFLPRFVHKGMLKFFRYNIRHVPPVPSCDASSIGFTLDKYKELARPWYECSVTRQCIAPDGSSRENHRQDQDALTVIASMTGNLCEGIDASVKRHTDKHPDDLSSVNPTQCYTDPLQVLAQYS